MYNTPLVITTIVLALIGEFILGFTAGKCHEILLQIKRDLNSISERRAK